MRDDVLKDHVKKFEAGLGQKITIEKFNEALSHHVCAEADTTTSEELEGQDQKADKAESDESEDL